MSNPTPREVELLANLDEAEALIASLRARLVALNVEVRSRDAVIADLRKASPETPEKEDE